MRSGCKDNPDLSVFYKNVFIPSVYVCWQPACLLQQASQAKYWNKCAFYHRCFCWIGLLKKTKKPQNRVQNLFCPRGINSHTECLECVYFSFWENNKLFCRLWEKPLCLHFHPCILTDCSGVLCVQVSTECSLTCLMFLRLDSLAVQKNRQTQTNVNLC